MGRFFHGWRRKTGCVTFVMALVLFGAYLRSLAHFDLMAARADDTTIYFLMSSERGVSWKRERLPHPLRGPRFFFEIDGVYSSDILAPGGEEELRPDWSIPYWSLVIPLAMLSACLILWKPRRASANAPDELTTVDGPENHA